MAEISPFSFPIFSFIPQKYCRHVMPLLLFSTKRRMGSPFRGGRRRSAPSSDLLQRGAFFFSFPRNEQSRFFLLRAQLRGARPAPSPSHTSKRNPWSFPRRRLSRGTRAARNRSFFLCCWNLLRFMVARNSKGAPPPLWWFPPSRLQAVRSFSPPPPSFLPPD